MQWLLRKRMNKAPWVYIVYEDERGWKILHAKSTGKLDKEKRLLVYYLENETIQIRPWKIITQYPTAAYYYNLDEAFDLVYYLNTKEARP